jgi:hypothetical protein
MFDQFSDQAQIWMFGFEQELNADEGLTVNEYLSRLVRQWHAHGRPVHGDFKILFNRFVIIVSDSELSGCSIDSMVQVFKDLRDNQGLDALNEDLIYFERDDEIIALERHVFQERVDQGKIDEHTPVYNLTPANLGQWRAGLWRVPFGQSWHREVFTQSA